MSVPSPSDVCTLAPTLLSTVSHHTFWFFKSQSSRVQRVEHRVLLVWISRRFLSLSVPATLSPTSCFRPVVTPACLGYTSRSPSRFSNGSYGFPLVSRITRVLHTSLLLVQRIAGTSSEGPSWLLREPAVMPPKTASAFFFSEFFTGYSQALQQELQIPFPRDLL